MKFKSLFFLGVAAAFFGISCDKESSTVERREIDCAELSSCIGTNFNDFVNANEKYQNKAGAGEGTASFNVFYKSLTQSYDMTLTVSSDKNGVITEMNASVVDAGKSLELWNFFMEQAGPLNLGTFLGMKHKGDCGGGLIQTIDESISFVAQKGTDGNYMYPVFSFVSGSVYLVPELINGTFVLSLLRSYYVMDYAEASSLVGTDYDAFAQSNYITGNKLSAWGSNYIYFDYVKDGAGNVFHLDVNGDSESKIIASFKATLDYEYHTDATEQLEIWKSYAKGDPSLGLGTFSKAYTSSFGSVGTEFATQQEAIEYVETNGRPGGFSPDVVVCYQNGEHTITITLKSLYIYVEVK